MRLLSISREPTAARDLERAEMDAETNYTPAGPGLTLIACPGCDAPAEIEWMQHLASTDGPMNLAKIRCLHRHWFLMPIDRVG